jgi:hypothetical protein
MNVAFALFVAVGAQGWAQEAAASAPAQAAPTAAAKPRTVSPALAAMLAATMPKYDPSKDRAEKRAPGSIAEDTKSKSGIVRLSKYIVREQRPPTERDIMTKRGLEQWAMNTYLGSAYDFDRGVLNHTTLNALWSKIPVLGMVPFFPATSNEERAMTHYYDEGLPGEIKELCQLDALGRPVPGGLQPPSSLSAKP